MNCRLPFGFAAGAVDVLDPQQKSPPLGTGEVMGEDGGIGMAQMQRAGRRGGEAGYDSPAVNAVLARSV